MSAKDLNLSFDRDFREDRAARGSRSRQPAASGLRAVRDPEVARPGKARPGKAHGSRRGGSPWLAATIALANMAFLLLAGLWLSGAGREPVPERPASGALADVTSSLHAVQAQLGELRREMTLLQAALDAQRQLLVAAHLARTAEQENADDPGVAAGGSAGAAQWHINLGRFATRPEAVAQQETLASLGYTGIELVAGGGDGAFTLRLPGFAGRAEAEAAANDIMGQTNLNGLWVAAGN